MERIKPPPNGQNDKRVMFRAGATPKKTLT